MYSHILVPVDLDTPSDWTVTLPRAVSLARLTGARLHILTVVSSFGSSVVGEFFPGAMERNVATTLLASLKQRTDTAVPEDIPVQNMVVEGQADEAVLRMAEQVKADLIVIGGKGTDLGRLLPAPRAARVVRRASCSVLVVRE